MSDIKLFRLTAGKASELQGDASDLEKPRQTRIEATTSSVCPAILEPRHSVGA